MKEACGNCTWFHPEPNITVDSESPVAQEHLIKNPALKSAMDGGSRPPTYGKCRASYQDEENITQKYDMGKLSSSLCSATDNLGYNLFIVG